MNLTYETIESAYQCVQRRKSLIQEFGVTLIYIKVETNIVADYFSRIPMVNHTHKSEDTNLE